MNTPTELPALPDRLFRTWTSLPRRATRVGSMMPFWWELLIQCDLQDGQSKSVFSD